MNPSKPANPWLTSVFNLVSPAFGYFYLGLFKKGITLFIISEIITVTIGYILAKTLMGAVLGFVIHLGLYIYIIVDCIRLIKLEKVPPKGKYQQKRFLFLFFILCFVANGLVSKMIPFEAFFIPSASMCPSLINGDRVIVARNEMPKRGQIAIFKSPRATGGAIFLKRVIGLPGDKISFKNNVVFVNDQAINQADVTTGFDLSTGCGENLKTEKIRVVGAKLDQTQFAFLIDGDHPVSDFDEIVVAPESVFLLGDNLNNSFDSRFFGTVEQSTLLGTAKYIYFSYSRGHFRWNRVGLPLN